MILSRPKNRQAGFLPGWFRNEPYLIINTFFAGVIVVIIIYSGIFSPYKNNYPVVCLHERITGEPCFSCGLSHSFSLILRGQIEEAYKWNIFGMRVFIFFVSQLIMRVVFSAYYLRTKEFRKELLLFDSTGSVLLFIITFWPFIRNILETFLNQL